MRILTNDYLSNVSDDTLTAKGGPAQFARMLADGMVAAGNEWVGIYTSPTAPTEGYEEVVGTQGKRFIGVRLPETHQAMLRDASRATLTPSDYEDEVVRIQRIIADVQPDLLFLNGFSVHAWTIAEAAFRAKLPVVIQHAGIFTKELAMYSHWFSPAALAFGKALEAEVATKATVNIFLNDASHAAFLATVQPEHVAQPVIIPIPHAGWAFAPVNHQASEERVLGVVARWDNIKNHEAVLAIAQEITRQGLPWRIRAVTHIPDTEHKAEFKEAYRTAIEVLEPVEREALTSFYESVDALLLPSHFETAGMVVIEALAVGKPTLISPHVGWVSEYNACGMDSWISDFSNAEEVVARLKEQFARDAWPELAMFSAHVQEHHDPKVIQQTYQTLFNEVIA